MRAVFQDPHVQEEQIFQTDGEVVEQIVQEIEQTTEQEPQQQQQQTIYLDADGRGTATTVVDGKEVRSTSICFVCFFSCSSARKLVV